MYSRFTLSQSRNQHTTAKQPHSNKDVKKKKNTLQPPIGPTDLKLERENII